jgi:preprotein translocase subunit SecB
MLNENTNVSTAKQSATPQYRIKGIYLRNASLETGISPLLLRSNIQPEMKLELRVNTKSLEDQDEVVLDLSLTVRDNSSLIYLLKIQQAGYFILNTPLTLEKKAFILNTTCPNLIYPYVCQMANILSVQAGFLPVNLMPIDFIHMYEQQNQQQVVKQTKDPTNLEEQKLTNLNPQRQAVSTFQLNNKWADVATATDADNKNS